MFFAYGVWCVADVSNVSPFVGAVKLHQSIELRLYIRGKELPNTDRMLKRQISPKPKSVSL